MARQRKYVRPPPPRPRIVPPDERPARLKAWRLRHRLTQDDLGRRLGLTAATVRCYERGCWANGKPVTDRAWRTMELLCISVELDIWSFDFERVSLNVGAHQITKTPSEVVYAHRTPAAEPEPAPAE